MYYYNSESSLDIQRGGDSILRRCPENYLAEWIFELMCEHSLQVAAATTAPSNHRPRL